jgi:hypothetical protein
MGALHHLAAQKKSPAEPKPGGAFPLSAIDRD